MSRIDLGRIRQARDRIGASIRRTPVLQSASIDAATGTSVWLKCENFQRTGSFKSRGALNAVECLTPEQRRNGVVTVSAGNHAQALAWAAGAAGLSAVVVMPAHAARSKVAASEGYGATVLFEPDSSAAFIRARAIADEEGRTFVHPFDDADIMAGAGTVGLEILEDVPDAEIIVVPVGGGGLIGGIASAIHAVAPGVKVYGVEPAGAAAMRKSLDAGRPVHLDSPPRTIADGLAAPMAGEHTFAVVNELVEDIVLVDDQQIADAMRYIITRTKLLVEPAAAAAVAALIAGLVPTTRTSRVVAILSGGNVDLDRLIQP